MTHITAAMSLERLGLEADDLGCGPVTLRPDEDGDGWFAFCSSPPEPHVARGKTGKEAFARLLCFVQRFGRVM